MTHTSIEKRVNELEKDIAIMMTILCLYIEGQMKTDIHPTAKQKLLEALLDFDTRREQLIKDGMKRELH